MENSVEGLQELKTELPYNPTISLLGIYPKETKTLTQKDKCTPSHVCRRITCSSQDMETN